MTLNCTVHVNATDTIQAVKTLRSGLLLEIRPGGPSTGEWVALFIQEEGALEKLEQAIAALRLESALRRERAERMAEEAAACGSEEP